MLSGRRRIIKGEEQYSNLINSYPHSLSPQSLSPQSLSSQTLSPRLVSPMLALYTNGVRRPPTRSRLRPIDPRSILCQSYLLNFLSAFLLLSTLVSGIAYIAATSLFYGVDCSSFAHLPPTHVLFSLASMSIQTQPLPFAELSTAIAYLDCASEKMLTTWQARTGITQAIGHLQRLIRSGL